MIKNYIKSKIDAVAISDINQAYNLVEQNNLYLTLAGDQARKTYVYQMHNLGINLCVLRASICFAITSNPSKAIEIFNMNRPRN